MRERERVCVCVYPNPGCFLAWNSLRLLQNIKWFYGILQNIEWFTEYYRILNGFYGILQNIECFEENVSLLYCRKFARVV